MNDFKFFDNIQDAKERKKKLVSELMEVRNELRAFYDNNGLRGVPFSHFSKENREKRSNLSAKVIDIESKISEINKSINDDNKKYDILVDLIKETLTPDIYFQIKQELNRRIDGEHPTRVSLNIEDCQKAKIKNKSLMNELIWHSEQLISARRSINKYISEKEPEVNKADFLKDVSALNKSIPPLSEIEKKIFSIKKLNEK